MSSSTVYRKDIDGMRALAVSVIVLFHMGVSQLAGGYVGVDIFFVISGFLITGLVLKDIRAQKFSFATFYMRRLRRLAPSLLVVLMGTLAAGYLFFSPDQFERLGRSTVAAVFSVSNIFFWTEAGYFDEVAINKPLLHLWSLAVEEQFYLVWPLLLLGLSRLKKTASIVFATVALGVISVLAGEVMLSRDPSAAFFLTPFRIAEFALGAVLALRGGFEAQSRTLRNSASVLGAVLIIVSVLALDESSRFPGVLSLVPCIGAALIIAAGPEAVINRALSLSPIRYIGRASYSIYLAHWPILVFYAYEVGYPDSAIQIAGLCIAAFATGAFLYHAVETPFRLRDGAGYRVSGPTLRWMSISTVITTLVACGIVIDQKGIPSRLPKQMQALFEAVEDGKDARKLAIRQTTCHFSSKSKAVYDKLFDECLPKDRSDMIVVLGDSHAADLYAALSRNFADRNVVQLTGAGCAMTRTGPIRKTCADWHGEMLAWIEDNRQNIDAVLYTQRGAHLLFGDPELEEKLTIDDTAPRRIRSTLETISQSGMPVWFVGPRPEFHPKIDVILARSRSMNKFHDEMGAIDLTVYGALDQMLQDEFAGSPVNYISSYDAICEDGRCDYTYGDNLPIFVDYAHWALKGGAYVVQQLGRDFPEFQALMTDK
ncbi:acyltransferase family protein [Actibacterium lipolyticum]|uniref:O-acetyltransferase OatA n=1 Tax=Actibacterium lipolyticum TaxID=1524263 RepID=A0A238KJ10_9RHOB|nr:acyltransferase family protein [Actibacterium lipolyticum]SMX42678.1 O-acetyltransferase OatA [Actibacterium lipolyticum]